MISLTPMSKTEFRRKGFAKETFKALERTLQGLNVNDIRLHVFRKNKAAQSLYTQLGFETTSTHMRKTIALDTTS